MPEKCAACGKTVYVVEKLTILNKTWHKWCFKCVTCGTVLTMKNYSAVGGKPYCKPHYPTPGTNDPNAPAPEAGTGYGDTNRGSTQTTKDDAPAPAANFGAPKAKAAPAQHPPAPAHHEPEPQYDQQYDQNYDQGGYDQNYDQNQHQHQHYDYDPNY